MEALSIINKELQLDLLQHVYDSQSKTIDISNTIQLLQDHPTSQKELKNDAISILENIAIEDNINIIKQNEILCQLNDFRIQKKNNKNIQELLKTIKDDKSTINIPNEPELQKILEYITKIVSLKHDQNIIHDIVSEYLERIVYDIIRIVYLYSLSLDAQSVAHYQVYDKFIIARNKALSKKECGLDLLKYHKKQIDSPQYIILTDICKQFNDDQNSVICTPDYPNRMENEDQLSDMCHLYTDMHLQGQEFYHSID